MSDHYYTQRPTSESRRSLIEASIRGETMRFQTDTSVFSRQAVDFGSRLLIETVMLPASGRILDVGCGYGPIGLFAAKLAGRDVQVVLCDMNERALALSRDNAELNGLDRVRVVHSDVYDGLDESERFDCILSNPPIRAGKQTVHRILEEAPGRLQENGSLWIVIRKQQGAPSALKKLEACFPFVEVKARKKGYYVICATCNL